MPVTSPDSIYFSDVTTTMDPNAISAAQATSLQAALALRQRFEFVWANAAARTAQTGMAAGATGYQVDTKTEYIYESTTWRLKTPHAEFTASQSVGNTSSTLLGTFTLTASSSTSSVMATPGGNGQIVITDPGIYAISSYTKFNNGAQAVGSRGILDISLVTTFLTPEYRLELPSAATEGGTALPNLRLTTANTSLYFSTYQASGVTVTATTKARITRVG